MGLSLAEMENVIIYNRAGDNMNVYTSAPYLLAS